MIRNLTSIIALFLLVIATNSFAQHTLQFDNGPSVSTILGSTPGGQYLMPPGGGTILTTGGGSPSLAWLTAANPLLTDGVNNFLGTTSAVPIRIVTNGTGNLRMLIEAGGNIAIGAAAASTRLDVNSSGVAPTERVYSGTNQVFSGAGFSTGGLALHSSEVLGVGVVSSIASLPYGAGNYSTLLEFLTSPNGATAPIERVRIDRDGNVTIFNGVLNMSTHQINNVVDPTLAQDAATKNYVDGKVTGAVSGTINTVAKFTAANVVGNSLLTDNGATLSYNSGFFTVSTVGQVGALGGTFTNTAVNGRIFGITNNDNNSGGGNSRGLDISIPNGAGAGNTYTGILFNVVGGAGIANDLLGTSGNWFVRSSGLGSFAGLNPKTDNTFDLGTSALQWRNIYYGSTSATSGVIYQNTRPFLHAMGGTANIFAGSDAGNLLATLTGIHTVGVGNHALSGLSSGSDNTAVGYYALFSNSTGGQNTAVGQQALTNNTFGNSNVAVGSSALITNTTGFNNTAVGSGALSNNGTTAGNTAVGQNALLNNANGFNTALGVSAGSVNITGVNNTYVGANTQPTGASATFLNNATAIGANATVGASNSLVLGSGANVGIGTSTPSQLLDVQNGHAIINNNDNVARELRFREPSGSGGEYTAFKAQAQAANVTYTLPLDGGTVGQVLTTSGGATPTLSWTTVAGGGGGPVYSLTSTAVANYAATNTDQFVQVTVTTGNKIVTLPNANTFAAGQTITIKNLDPTSTGNTVTINTTGQNIDDAAPGAFFADVLSAYQAAHLYSNGVNGWYSY